VGKAPPIQHAWQQALAEFPVLATLPGEGAPLKEEVRIYLRDPRPVKLRNFRTSAEESNFIKGHVAELRAKGILEVSRSEYSSRSCLYRRKTVAGECV